MLGCGSFLLLFFRWFLGLSKCGGLVVGVRFRGITVGVAVVFGLPMDVGCLVRALFRRFPLWVLGRLGFLIQYFMGSCAGLDCMHLYFIGTVLRGKGLGGLLLEAVERVAVRLGFRCVCLESLAGSWVSSWYFRRGFVPVGVFRVGRYWLVRFVKHIGG